MEKVPLSLRSELAPSSSPHLPTTHTNFNGSRNVALPCLVLEMLSDTTTLIVGYVLYFICFVLIAVRLIATWARGKRWTTGDYWMLAASAILVLRVVVIHLVLEYDTNNVYKPELLTPNDIQRRAFGSKMALVGRSCYATL